MAQVGAASSLSDTEAGSRCAWSIYTWEREIEIGARVNRHIRSDLISQRQERKVGAGMAQKKNPCVSVFEALKLTIQIITRPTQFQAGHTYLGYV